MEVMYAETSNAVMGALLIHDIRNAKAPCAGSNNKSMENPLQLFQYGGFHGGTWRCGFKMGSIGELSAVSYYLKTYFLQISGSVGLFAAMIIWLVTGKVNPF
jgi:hypothetical protein